MSVKIAIVGEAWGETEERMKLPFVGAAGQELSRLLIDAGIDRSECFLTNTFSFRPAGNQIDRICGPKKEAGAGYKLPPLRQGKYVLPQYLGELERLKKELTDVRPNLIIAAGNVPTWALLQRTGISNIRGTVAPCVLVPGLKVIPIYNPSAILRDWSLRPVTVLDLLKAAKQAEFPELRIPHRRVHVPETVDEVRQIEAMLASAKELSVDIETVNLQISCIGFAPSPTEAYVIPIIDYTKPGNSYWFSLVEEVAVWASIRRICQNEAYKTGQNFLYDMQYLWRFYGIWMKNMLHDTMLMHHAFQPESLKGLGFLGSVYSEEPAWKLNRPRGREILKKDE